jgi:hypothetical protein
VVHDRGIDDRGNTSYTLSCLNLGKHTMIGRYLSRGIGAYNYTIDERYSRILVEYSNYLPRAGSSIFEPLPLSARASEGTDHMEQRRLEAFHSSCLQ